MKLKLVMLKGRAMGAAPRVCKEGICPNTPHYTEMLPSCSDKGLDTEMFALPLFYSLAKPLCHPLHSTCKP